MTLKTVRHETNPFIKNMIIPVGGKNIQISTLGKGRNIIIDQKTGEVTGTHVVARKKVDKEKFIKVFVDYMAMTFELTKSGNKALRVVMWAVQNQQIGKDTVMLDMHTYNSFIEEFKNKNIILDLSYTTFKRGLAEVEKAQIIAKTTRAGSYFINPQCIFNGDRVAFTTIIEQ